MHGVWRQQDTNAASCGAGDESSQDRPSRALYRVNRILTLTTKQRNNIINSWRRHVDSSHDADAENRVVIASRPPSRAESNLAAKLPLFTRRPFIEDGPIWSSSNEPATTQYVDASTGHQAAGGVVDNVIELYACGEIRANKRATDSNRKVLELCKLRRWRRMLLSRDNSYAEWTRY